MNTHMDLYHYRVLPIFFLYTISINSIYTNTCIYFIQTTRNKIFSNKYKVHNDFKVLPLVY